MPFKKRYLALVAGVVALYFVVAREPDVHYDLYGAQPGQPVAGLTAAQLDIFKRGKVVFDHDFTVEEGLGPLFNGRSCFECHGKPVADGLEGRDVTTTGIVRIGAVSPHSPLSKDLKKARSLIGSDSFLGLVDKGGPAIERRSITQEFPDKFPSDCNVEVGLVPPEAQFVSLRHAGPLLGFGLIEAIPEKTILANMMQEAAVAPDLVGRSAPLVNPLTRTTKIGRFGWKCQNPDLLMFTAEALNTEMGVTTYLQNTSRSGMGVVDFPDCILPAVPKEPNDKGENLVLLTDFQALLAPPARPPVTEEARQGGKVFEKLRCAVCHTAQMMTAPVVQLPDPDSPFPHLRYIEVKALANQPVRLYSDLLLHDMGPGLADGIVQNTARGAEWRTTPLWGIRMKKFFLHNGRASTIDQAIMAHGGQAESVKQAYARLPETEKQSLIAFLKAL